MQAPKSKLATPVAAERRSRPCGAALKTEERLEAGRLGGVRQKNRLGTSLSELRPTSRQAAIPQMIVAFLRQDKQD